MKNNTHINQPDFNCCSRRQQYVRIVDTNDCN